jgi:hypothetical protein
MLYRLKRIEEIVNCAGFIRVRSGDQIRGGQSRDRPPLKSRRAWKGITGRARRRRLECRYDLGCDLHVAEAQHQTETTRATAQSGGSRPGRLELIQADDGQTFPSPLGAAVSVTAHPTFANVNHGGPV